MSKAVEFFFDFGSPTSYLAWTQLPRIAQEHCAEIIWRPVLLGAIFKATGNSSPVAIPAKGRYMLNDMARFARRYGVPLVPNPHFPINTLQLMRGATGYLGTDDFPRYVKAIYEGIWTQRLNLGDVQQVAVVLTQAGLDPATFEQLINDEGIKETLKNNTDEAVKRGLFGVPAYFVGNELFFGQDRLDFVAEALQG
ncbi:2-hydroxychromene-2-carboxylate isomerase [Ectopseudomonas mendocina]|uniref:2-hydroxychromene-2-carboxylate isomerase n=1 Tax=Ectopseudomonas mendocina TaxID=300 RepID=A0ABZ2RM65_ECTME